MAIINQRALFLAIEKPAERAYRQAAISLAKERFDNAKQEFLTEFLEHPVSTEISQGPEGEGDILSATGNLFGFIGFQAGDKPVSELYQFLAKSITLGKTPTYDRVRKQYIFKVNIPSKEEIKDETPMPFGTARSWVYSIESGISGLNQFLSSVLAEAWGRKETNLGRSSGGIQLKGNIRAGGYQPQKYLTQLLKDFVQNVK